MPLYASPSGMKSKGDSSPRVGKPWAGIHNPVGIDLDLKVDNPDVPLFLALYGSGSFFLEWSQRGWASNNAFLIAGLLRRRKLPSWLCYAPSASPRYDKR